MSPQHKVLLTAAFAALGPERVKRGLKATGHSWIDCFLAFAADGEPGAFVRALENRSGGRTRMTSPAARLASRWEWWTRRLASGTTRSGASRALALEWLELNRTAVPTGPMVGA